MQILVRNLARDLTQQELEEMFRKFGQVENVVIVKDEKTGGSKGFGFVEMNRVEEAEEAIRKLNGKKKSGNAIRVKRAADSTVAKGRRR